MKMIDRSRWRTTFALTVQIPIVLALLGCEIMGYEKAYEKTPKDTVQIKQIPPSKILLTEGTGDYFTQENSLFRRLFSYIRKNDVAMTVPVEARIEQANMVFYVGRSDLGKEMKSNENVSVEDRPERLVAALGAGGSYTESNVTEAMVRLKAWLKGQHQYESAGEMYAVFWNSPFMPGFMKRFEVHVPVRRVEGSGTGATGNKSGAKKSRDPGVEDVPAASSGAPLVKKGDKGMKTLRMGDTAPDFTLPDQNGKEVSLKDLLGRGTVVLYFYPKDETSVCTRQACAFRDSYEVFLEAGAQVVGISSDSVTSHGKFASGHHLPFPLLSDEGGKVRKRYGAVSLLGLPGRVTYIIDRQGKVRLAFSSMLNAEKHIEEALEWVRSR